MRVNPALLQFKRAVAFDLMRYKTLVEAQKESLFQVSPNLLPEHLRFHSKLRAPLFYLRL